MLMKRRLFFLFSALFAIVGGAKSQNVLTVYEGTEKNQYVPAYIYYFDDFTRSQFVIPADDLSSMNGGTITSIKFYTTSDYVPYTTDSEVDVYLKEVSYTTMNKFESKTSATIVYQGKLSIVAAGSGGEMTINLTTPFTPFTYQGGNLLVGIENTTDVSYKNIYFYGQTVNNAAYAGSNSSSLNGVTGSVRHFIPQTTFTYTGGSPVYDKPTALSVDDITTNSATISWTAPTDATGYTYQYKKASDDDWSTEKTTNNTSVELSGLTQGTNYNFRVKAVYNSDGESAFAIINFSTDCGTFSLPYEEGFESGLGCWSLVDCNTYTGLATGAQHDGNVGFYFYYSSNPPQYLISPEFDGASAIGVTFWYANYDSDYPETFHVGYSTTTKEASAFTWGEEITAADTEWTQFEGNFPAGTKYVAIKYTSNDQYYLFLDDFSFTAGSIVTKPTNLTATEIGTTSAKLNWEGSHDSYVLQYRTAAQATPLSVWHQVGDDVTPTNKLKTYTFDLSDYSGTGAIAIRHYNVSDMYYVNIDDIVVTNAGGTEVFSEDFESGSIPATWSNVDYDGDGYKWSIRNTTDPDKYNQAVLNGSYCATSASWIQNVGAVTPDNWLIIPDVELGGTLTLVARGQDPDYPADNFGVFVTQESYDPVSTGSWSSEINTTAKTYQLTDLSAGTPYEWQVKGILGTDETNWATSTFTTIQDGTKTFVTDGNWNVAANWFPTGVPTATDAVTIDADVIIPSGVTAVAKRATIGTGSITIEDGAQLKQGAASLKVTMLKEIDAASNGFITSPFNGRTEIGYNPSWSYVDDPTDGDFDFYAFDATAANGEWINYEVAGNTNHNFFYSGILWGEGYFYANDAATTLEFTGTTWSSLNYSMTKDVTYDGSSTSPYNGWRLIGNPYTCTAYVRYLDGDDNQTTATFYKLNDAGNGYDVYNNDISLAPGEAAFIKVTASGKILYSSEDLGGTISKTGTATAPYLPALGLAVNQGASNPNIVLANASSNATTLTTYNEETVNVILNGRSLVQNDSWNTLCLPFDVTLATSIFVDATAVKVLDNTSTTFAGNTLSVMFKEVPAMITAGTPFIVKWASGSGITNPTFSNVTINNTATASVTFTGGKFVGTFSPVTLTGNDMSLLYFGAENKLYWPSNDVNLKSFRAYFDLDGAVTAPDVVIDFEGNGDNEATGIFSTTNYTNEAGVWYDLQGRKLDTKPTAKGVYIVNGRKAIIK